MVDPGRLGCGHDRLSKPHSPRRDTGNGQDASGFNWVRKIVVTRLANEFADRRESNIDGGGAQALVDHPGTILHQQGTTDRTARRVSIVAKIQVVRAYSPGFKEQPIEHDGPDNSSTGETSRARNLVSGRQRKKKQFRRGAARSITNRQDAQAAKQITATCAVVGNWRNRSIPFIGTPSQKLN